MNVYLTVVETLCQEGYSANFHERFPSCGPLGKKNPAISTDAEQSHLQQTIAKVVDEEMEATPSGDFVLIPVYRDFSGKVTYLIVPTSE